MRPWLSQAYWPCRSRVVALRHQHPVADHAAGLVVIVFVGEIGLGITAQALGVEDHGAEAAPGVGLRVIAGDGSS